MKRLLLDMDPGIDDALALLLALGAERDKEVAIEGITAVAGNVEVEAAAENICRILVLAGRAYRIFQPGDVDQPGSLAVAAGAGAPLRRPLHTARFVHGEDGLGNTGLPPPKVKMAAHPDKSGSHSDDGAAGADAAVALILKKAARWPGEVTLVATGPLTNVARALSASPELARELREIVLMGGAATVPGNATPVAEFNIFADPEAAAAVFSSGARLTMVGLDVTTQVAFTAEDLKAWRGVEGPVAGFVCALAEFWFSRFKKAEFHLHDPVAVGVALERSLV
ncbi:MAG: nucleoside hydrolase, partial [Syntrophothermus sp.]